LRKVIERTKLTPDGRRTDDGRCVKAYALMAFGQVS